MENLKTKIKTVYYHVTCIVAHKSYKVGDVESIEAPEGLLKDQVIRKYSFLNPKYFAGVTSLILVIFSLLVGSSIDSYACIAGTCKKQTTQTVQNNIEKTTQTSVDTPQISKTGTGSTDTEVGAIIVICIICVIAGLVSSSTKSKQVISKSDDKDDLYFSSLDDTFGNPISDFYQTPEYLVKSLDNVIQVSQYNSKTKRVDTDWSKVSQLASFNNVCRIYCEHARYYLDCNPEDELYIQVLNILTEKYGYKNITEMGRCSARNGDS